VTAGQAIAWSCLANTNHVDAAVTVERDDRLRLVLPLRALHLHWTHLHLPFLLRYLHLPFPLLYVRLLLL